MFKTFPEFSRLTLNDRKEYESLIKDFPPIGDISFGSLMMWWNEMGGLAISRLNGNFVISYWIPGHEEHSGLALIGTSDVDESICTIFDYLRERGDEPRLVNVPEFVVNSMQYPELFSFKSGRGDDEYLISTSKFANSDNMPSYMRTRMRRFRREVGERNIELKDLDLAQPKIQKLLFDCVARWPRKGLNNINKLEQEVFPSSVTTGATYGVKCVAIFIAGALEAYCLYFTTHDRRYALVGHARVNYDIPRIFDYMVHAFSTYFEQRNIEFINIDADNDSVKMRVLKLALKPEHFFRKYTIEPAKSISLGIN